jgi:protein-tyrosine phosphatase
MPFSNYIKNTYGSKRGLLNSVCYFIKTVLGFYKRYQTLSVHKSTRFVFICSGNICRSPLAEYVAKKNGAEAISYGLDTRGGDSADARAIAFASTQGIDLTPHITQHISAYQPLANDVLVGMEPKHAQQLEILFGDKVPITLAGLWLNKKQAYIHDPYNSNSLFFNVCELQVVNAVQQLIAASRKV